MSDAGRAQYEFRSPTAAHFSAFTRTAVITALQATTVIPKRSEGPASYDGSPHPFAKRVPTNDPPVIKIQFRIMSVLSTSAAMNRPLSLVFLLLLFAAPALAQKPSAPAPRLNWQPWSDKAFADAKRENRFVLLDLEAVWCHWCHVMDANTYSDPTVIKLLQSRYIVVKADQDSRPDLATRYEDYGWPATIVFDSNGHEIVKRQGYL